MPIYYVNFFKDDSEDDFFSIKGKTPIASFGYLGIRRISFLTAMAERASLCRFTYPTTVGKYKS